MRQKRKDELLGMFPPLPDEIAEDMKNGHIFGRSRAANFCVFLSYGRELFVRCYHKYSRSHAVVEAQRYVFAKDGFVRYGPDKDKKWHAMPFREPVFYSGTFYNDYGYTILNADAILNSDMRYSRLTEWSNSSVCAISYLRLYCKHPNIEYLVESGYGGQIYIQQKGWSNGVELTINSGIDLKSNDLLKMLHLSRAEFKLLRGNEKYYFRYVLTREQLPTLKQEELLEIARYPKYYPNDLISFSRTAGTTVMRMFRYLSENDINTGDYRDYIEQCNMLRYDIRDTSIGLPHDFQAAHERCSQIIRIQKSDLDRKMFAKNMESREKFEFSSGELFLRQPSNMEEIVEEGRKLHHCVGGYASRHAWGKTNIFFIRKSDDPDTPYYTIEVSNNFTIIQCRGYRNDAGGEKPKEVTAFEEEYKHYLEELKNEQQRVRVKPA